MGLLQRVAISSVVSIAVGASFAADFIGPSERWRTVRVGENVAAIWLEQYPDGPRDCHIPVIVFLKGDAGWLTEEVSLERSRRGAPRRWLPDPTIPTAPAAFRAGDVVVPLNILQDGRRAQLWAYNVKIQHGNVLMMSGLGSEDVRLRRMGSFRAECRGETTPPERLVAYFEDVRAGRLRSGVR